MSDRITAGAVAIALTLMTIGGVRAADDGKYPINWKGQWTRVIHHEVEVQGAFDQTKPWGLGQQAPLTPEYQKVLADSMADQANGGLGNYPSARCYPVGMPHMMTFGTQEYVITPETTYILLSVPAHSRRIFTDGRDWPEHPQPTYGGYSIGRWIDQDGDGTYDMLNPRRGISRVRAPSMQAGCRWLSTINRSSRSGSSSTRPTPTSCISSPPSSIMP